MGMDTPPPGSGTEAATRGCDPLPRWGIEINPEGVTEQSPGLARSDYPGNRHSHHANPNAGCGSCRAQQTDNEFDNEGGMPGLRSVRVGCRLIPRQHGVPENRRIASPTGCCTRHVFAALMRAGNHVVKTQDRTVEKRNSGTGRRLGSTIRVDDYGRRLGSTMGESQDYFVAESLETGKGRFHREIGEFGQNISDRRAVCTPAWLSLPGLPVLPVRRERGAMHIRSTIGVDA
jgi:hypothetical protein